MNILKTLTKKSIKENFVLEIQYVTFANAKITSLYGKNLIHFLRKKEFRLVP